MAISTVLASFTEALNLSYRNGSKMAVTMLLILVPFEMFSFLIKGCSVLVIDLTALVNRKSPEFPFVVPKTKAEIRLGDISISILSSTLIAQFSCMARSKNKPSVDYYIKGLQNKWRGLVAALCYSKLFYMSPILIIVFLERNTRAVRFLRRDNMLFMVLFMKVAWMMVLTLVEQWSLVVVFMEEEGINGFVAILKAIVFVGKRKRKVFFLMGGIMAIKFGALMVLEFVNRENLKVNETVLFVVDRIAVDMFFYFVRFYTYLLCMVFYGKEK